MEVHHHPDLHHKPKAWKEYFLEFLMIFLAVTMGFFAESLREHTNDHVRENEYVKGILADLRSDSAQLHFLMNFYTNVQAKYDIVSNLLDDPVTIPNLLKAYRLTASADDIINFDYNDRTFSGLKNSGNFRLIKNEKVADGITGYYTFILHNYFAIEEAYRKSNYEIVKLRQNVFDYKIINEMGKWTTGTQGDIFISIYKPSPVFNNDSLLARMILASQKQFDKGTRNQKVFEWKNQLQSTIMFFDYGLKYGFISLQEKGAQLIHLIQEEYGLENE